MRLGETEASARRIGPIRCVDNDLVPVVAGFGDAGAVEISVNDGPFVAALGTITVIGGGYVYYNATAGDASERGFVQIKLEGICQESTFREEVEEVPQGIPVDTADAELLHLGGLRIVDFDGVELATVVGIDTEISINGAAWSAPAGVLTLIEDGYADYAPTTAEVPDVGWIAVKLTGTCQEFVFRATVIDPSVIAAVVAPTIVIVSPDPGEDPGDPGAFDEDLPTAQQTPIVIELDPDPMLAVVVVRYPGETLERVAYRRGSFRRGFAESSFDEVDGSVRRLHILPDGGWPESGDPIDIVIDIDAVGGGAISDIGASS